MCGVVGLIGTSEAAREAFLGLTTLQHRGQDAAGILTFDQDGFHRVKNLGLVESVFTRQNMETLTGNLCVGHARYSTVGKGDVIDVQPFLMSYPYGLGIVHNGNIVNGEELSSELKNNKRHLLTHSDTEIVLNMLAEGLAKYGEGQSSLSFEQICQSLQTVFDKVNGSMSIVTLIAGHGLLAFRDPNGIRPLIWGKRKEEKSDRASLPSGEAHMVASEAVALNFNGYEVVKDLAPGEVLFIDMQGNVHNKVLVEREARHCMFEWVYFASPESVIDGVPVYGSRIQLGKFLAKTVAQEFKKRNLEADFIVPVPETSRIAAIALSEELGIPYRELLIKNRYIKRTFILDSQDRRQKAVSLKLSPVRSEIKGKRLLMVDDSIVRGNTSKKLVELVRKAGASQVYFVSTCPPIRQPCYYGIDFPVQKELLAHERNAEQIEKELGADAVVYQTLEGLQNAILQARQAEPANGNGHSMKKPCMACLDGDYPSDVSAGKQFAESRVRDRRE